MVIGGVREARELPLVGEHNVLNALAAVAVGLERGLKPSEAVGRWPRWLPADKRGEVLRLGNITVINDCYNCNPKALNAMVDALAAMTAKRRIVVAGEMLELGPTGEELHRQAGQHVAEKKIDVLLGVSGPARSHGGSGTAGGIARGICSYAGRSRGMAGARSARWRRRF